MAAVLAGTFVVQPVLFAYAVTHVARAHVPEDRLGVPHENVTLTTSDGLELHGWYIPSRNGAAVVDFPGRLGTHRRPGCSPGTATACCCSTAAASAEARALPTCAAGAAKDIVAAVDWLKQHPEVGPERIGGISFSVGDELMLEAAAKDPDLADRVSRIALPVLFIWAPDGGNTRRPRSRACSTGVPGHLPARAGTFDPMSDGSSLE